MAKKADGTDDGQPEVTTDATTVNSDSKTSSDKAPETAAIAYVTMVRDESYPEPHTAQVHPDEVKNYYSGGWQVQTEEVK